MPSLAMSITVQPLSSGVRTESTAAKTMRKRYHLLALRLRLGSLIPFSSTTLPCVPLVGPAAHVGSSHCAGVPPAAWQLASYCCEMVVSSGMFRCCRKRCTSSIAARAAGTEPAASSTMIMPAAPPPAWIAVEPWWCGWYQNVPPMWLVGSLYV